MHAWPATLPALLLAGFQMEPQDAVARTQMESGPGRARRRHHDAPVRYTGELFLTGAQFALFEAWYEYQIDDGAAAFALRVPSGADNASEQEARFTAKYRATPLRLAAGGLHWRVSCQLEARRRALYSRELADLLVMYPEAEIIASDPAMHTLVHTTLPATLY